MSKKMNYVGVLLLVLTLFFLPFKDAIATDANKATSSVGIRFGDKREVQDDTSDTNSLESVDKNNQPAAKEQTNFPSTNEKQTVSLSIVGILVLALLLFFLIKRRMSIKKNTPKNGHTDSK